MSKAAVLFVALVACISVIDALPRSPGRFRPLARYQQKPRYSPRYAQYNRYRSARLEAENEEAQEDEVPVLVLPEDFPFTDLSELAGFPVDAPVADEPAPADDEVALSGSPDESADHETRVLPEPDTRAEAPSADYFALRFDGGLTGATVAVANSYSTGNGGKSESRALAFGNPADAVKHRRRH